MSARCRLSKFRLRNKRVTKRRCRFFGPGSVPVCSDFDDDIAIFDRDFDRAGKRPATDVPVARLRSGAKRHFGQYETPIFAEFNESFFHFP